MAKLFITNFGDKSVNVIRVIRIHTGLGLKEVCSSIKGPVSSGLEVVIPLPFTKLSQVRMVAQELEEVGASVKVTTSVLGLILRD